MTKATVIRLMKEYDEWHEAYLLIPVTPASQNDGVADRWTAYRQKIMDHLLRSPGRGTIFPEGNESPPQGPRRTMTQEL